MSSLIWRYKSETAANIQAKIISKLLGFYITVAKDNEGYFLSTKYAQGLTAKS